MDILNNIRYGVELERANMPDNGLNESPGLMNSLLGTLTGASSQGVENKRSAMRNAADKREYGDLYTSTTGKAWRDGMTGATALNEVKDFNEGKIDAKEEKLRGYNVADRNAGFKQQSVLADAGYKAAALQGQLGRQSAQDQYLHSSKTQEARYAHERSEGRLDRRHQSELADSKDGLQMQMAIMQNDLAEKRMDYDRETARMDKRSAAIAQLMSGLGSLGGAFSL